MLKKAFTYFLITSFLWASVVAPAKAFALPLVALVLEAASAASITFPQALTLSAAAHGAAIAYIKFTDPTGSGNNLIVQLNPKAAIDTPGGWTPPSAGYGQPNPPAGSVNPTSYNASSAPGGGCTGLETAALAHTCFQTKYQTTYAAQCAVGSGCVWTVNGLNGQVVVNGGAPQGYALSPVCPTGYTLSGSLCNMTNAAAVIKPPMNRDLLMRTGNTLARDPRQSPQDAMNASGPVPPYSAPSTGEIVAKNPQTGEVTNVKINQTDGSTTVTTTKANPDGTTSTVKTTTISAPDATTGQTIVTGQKTETVQGTGSAAGTTSTPGASPTPPTDVSNLATHSDNSAIQGAVDAAKNQAAADASQAHADSLAEQAKQDALKEEMTVKPTEIVAADIAAAKADADGVFTAFVNDFANVEAPTDLFVFTPSGLNPQACSVLSANFLGHSIVIDLCPYQQTIKDFAAYFLYLMTGASMFQIFLRRPEGS